MIERPPSARGPNSMRPWNQPITFSEASSSRRSREQRVVVQDRVLRAHGIELGLDRLGRKLRSEIRPVHAVRGRAAVAIQLPRLLVVVMPDDGRGADGTARVASGRLNPDVLERALLAAVGHWQRN